MSPAAKRGILVFVVGLALLVGALVFEYLYLTPGPGTEATVLAPRGAAAIGGPFTLTDQNGRVRHDTDFHGKLMLVYFGYTYCPDVCPTELQTMSQAMDILGAKGKEVQPIFITVDPERDTVEEMKAYAANFHPRLLALTGTPEEIARAARAYKVFYQKAPQADGGDYLMDHSSIVYLMGRDGRYLAHFGGDTTAEQMAEAIAKQLDATS
ncbi:MAG TPA: SCO family protein [Stellaceae bacterium]|nr:SCO family protein [Stellaceae bacterium]